MSEEMIFRWGLFVFNLCILAGFVYGFKLFLDALIEGEARRLEEDKKE